MQVASVIGRDFAFRILQTITGLREELKAYLLNLQGLEFIYEKSLFPELEYIFKHALTQEVAYNSLLPKRKKDIHKKIGKAIEQTYAERLEEFYEMLAYHFDQGEVWDKAVEYNNLALESIQDLIGPGTSNLFEIESQTRINLGENYLMTGDMQKARENLELVYENAKKPAYFLARTRWKPRCLLGLGELWLQAGDTNKAESFLSELFEHQWTDKFPYKKYQIRAWRLRSHILSAKGQLEDAKTELNRALTQAKQLGNPTQLWLTHQVLGNLLLKKGKDRDARAEFQTALKVVQGIAEGLTDAALKEGYLQSDPIQKLFSQVEGS